MNERTAKWLKNHLVNYEYTDFGWQECHRYEFDEDELKEYTKLIVQECVNVMLNTDEQKFVVETEGWELGGANHNTWDRGILDAVATVKEHFGVEE